MKKQDRDKRAEQIADAIGELPEQMICDALEFEKIRRKQSMREITYSQNGEYQIPDISLEETRGTIGKYGLMRKEYLRNHKVARFNILTLQNRLDSHLMEIDSQARQRVDNLMSELLEKNPAPDKMADGMAWTRHMNQIKAQAEELVIQEIIYN